MRVRAKSPGYDNIKIREIGEEFDLPDGSKGSWFEPVVTKKAKKQEADKQDASDIL